MSRTVGESESHSNISICYECSQICEGDVTYCHLCFDQRCQSDSSNEQRLRSTEAKWAIAEASLHKERSKTQRLETVGRSFRNMLEEGIHGDVTIYTGDDRTVGHRAILACRSPVFRAMFEHELKEKTSAVIRVDDIPTPAMRGLLLFLYTGEHDTKAMNEYGLSMLAAAHKYDVPELKRVCEAAVSANVSPNSVVETLFHARLYDAPRVKKACLECIARNLKEVAFTEDFRLAVLSKDDPELVLEIIQALATTPPVESGFRVAA